MSRVVTDQSVDPDFPGRYRVSENQSKDGDRNCRHCGITDIPIGLEIDGEPLAWIDDDLCSACADEIDAALHKDAARYRWLRNRDLRRTHGVFAGYRTSSISEETAVSGEDLDRAIDAGMGLEIEPRATLESRLADCLAACVDTPVLTVSDLDGAPDRRLELRLGSFNRDLSERAADLLEEAGR